LRFTFRPCLFFVQFRIAAVPSRLDFICHMFREFDGGQPRANNSVRQQPTGEPGMKKTALIAAILAALPALASAMCEDRQQVMSCADGLVWDEATKTCAQQVSS
jgi:hypothetical protein